jgi:hypothetical protein
VHKKERTNIFIFFLKYLNLDSYLTVSADRQPPPSDLKNGYTISAWLQPFADLNSYIVAKTTNDGSRFFYTLKVTTGNSGAIFLFGYSASGSNVSF